MMSLFIFSKHVSLLIKVCMLLYLALTGVFNPADNETHSRLPETRSLYVAMSESSRREFYNSRPLTPPGIRFRTTAVHINTGTVGDNPAAIPTPSCRTTLS